LQLFAQRREIGRNSYSEQPKNFDRRSIWVSTSR
jgi:hypothetical protein